MIREVYRRSKLCSRTVILVNISVEQENAHACSNALIQSKPLYALDGVVDLLRLFNISVL